MKTCRECVLSREFDHFRKDGHPKDQQNVYCTKHDTAEPAWGWVSLGKNRERFQKIEALHCFRG